MGSIASTHEPISIQESLLICADNINETALFCVKKCLYKHPDFKNYSIIQYEETKDKSLPQTITTCVTLRAVFERDFTYESLIDKTISVKNLNHPSILRVYSSMLQLGLSSLFLKVESSLPCKTLLKCFGREELTAGLYSILQALDFLHTKVDISHNNLQVESIFIDTTRKWKLCGFEFSLPFNELDQNKIEIFECMKSQGDDSKARKFSSSHPNCYDMYCFGRMVLRILDDQQYGDHSLTTVLEKSCLHESPSLRLSAAKLLLHREFKNSYSFTYNFLTDYMLKNDSEKLEFFTNFPSLIRDIPEELLCSNIIPLLLSPSILMDYPSKQAIGLLLTPFQDDVTKESGLVSECTFRSRLAPCIINLFKMHELSTRLLLLCHLPSYARLLGHQALMTIVLPEVCLGLYDSNDIMVSASLSGLSHLANLLGPSPVLSHLINLGEQLRSRGLLTIEPAVDKTALLFSNISLGRAKPIVYNAAKPWKRCSTLFMDASPKVDRQSRDVPYSKLLKVTQRLCDVAALSSNYTPPPAPLFQPPRPPITKLSQSHVEPKRTFSSIFASLDKSSEDAPSSENNDTCSQTRTLPDLSLESNSQSTNDPKCTESAYISSVVTSTTFSLSIDSAIPFHPSYPNENFLSNSRAQRTIEIDRIFEELEPTVSFPSEESAKLTNYGCDDCVHPEKLVYSFDKDVPTDWDDGWEDT